MADLLVACCAMTFNATLEITGKWNFGRVYSIDTYFVCTYVPGLICTYRAVAHT